MSDPTPLAALKGQPAYELAVHRFRSGDPLGALAAAHTAQCGAEALVNSSAWLARRQGRSWAEIGHALNITRQSAQSRFGGGADNDATVAAGGMASAQVMADETIEVASGSAGRRYTYPVKVFRLPDAALVAVVAAPWGNPSLLDVSHPIMAEVEQHWPGAHVLECWSSDTLGTSVGSAGHYAWSGGNGGHVPADLADLAARGLDLR